MHFPNDHKRYSTHLQVSILHRVAPIKVYLTIYEKLKNSYLKSFCTINKHFWLTSIQGLHLHDDNDSGIEVGLQLY